MKTLIIILLFPLFTQAQSRITYDTVACIFLVSERSNYNGEAARTMPGYNVFKNTKEKTEVVDWLDKNRQPIDLKKYLIWSTGYYY